jgi:hypothetical protein
MHQQLKNWLLNNLNRLKTILLIVGLFFVNNSAYTQSINLIPNPSFEYLDSCSYYTNTIKSAKPWDTLHVGGGGGPNLFNKCSFGVANRSPNTGIGYRYARTGNGFVGFDFYSSLFLLRFYSQVPLSQTLQNGKSYSVTFYASRPSATQYAIDRVGAYLDNGSISTTYGGLVNVIPQVENPAHNIITDTVNWTKIQGCFTANGTESYLTLGNFYPDSLVDTVSAPYNSNYGVVNNSGFFIDDVSVIESNAIIKADNDTTILKGDTITLGKSIEGMPVDWYDLQGNLLAASSTLKVSPITKTSYVVKMDLCGNVTYDTVTVSVSTGVEQLVNDNEKLMVYPNPCGEKLLVTGYQSRTFGIGNTLEITDVLGRILMVRQAHHDGITVVGHADEGSISINVETLPSGVYFIKATDKNGNVKIGKFVKE